MASRRMFAKSITDSARFLRMPAVSRLLYYDLGMQADDDGVVEAFTVIRTTGASEDDLKVLESKGFVSILNDDLVTYICDWEVNNRIRKERHHPSIHMDLLEQWKRDNQLSATCQPDDNQLSVKRQPSDNQLSAQVSLGKASIGKARIVQDSQEQRNAGQERGVGGNPHSRNLNRIEFKLDENFSFSQADKETVISQLQDMGLINQNGLDLLEQHKGNPAELLKAIEARQEDLRIDS